MTDIYTKPVVELSSIEANSITSAITRASQALVDIGVNGVIPEMTERCMKSQDFRQTLEILKDYVVIIP